MIIIFYFKLRLKQVSRILKELGIARSLFLSILLSLVFYLLINTSYRWIVPTATIIGVMCYHNERKDKDFLSQQTRYAISLFRIEYLLIGMPFIAIECLKNHFVEAGIIVATLVLLPKLITIKWKLPAIPLPFLYKGGLEYVRMFRLYGWLYLLLFLIALIGALHHNIRIGKVALMVWGILQTTAFTSIPQREELASFLNYQTLQKYLVLSNAWNATITSLPFIGIILSFSFSEGNVLFSASAILGIIFYLWNLGMTRYISSTTITIAIYQLMVLIPLYFGSCLTPFLLIPFILINGICSIFLKNNSKKIWN